MQIGPIGSRADYLIAVVTTDGVRAHGCFSGTLMGSALLSRAPTATASTVEIIGPRSR